MLTLTDLSLQRGGQWLLRNVNVVILPRQRVAVVGANGAGKSSLFQLILGHLSADQGAASLPGGCRIAYMAQEVASSDRSALDHVLDGDQQLRRLQAALAAAEASGDLLQQAHLHGDLDACEAWSAERRAAALLRGLGFAEEDLLRSVRTFSGGWRIRLNLAQALMMPSDLLLLDEPTNHLDIDAGFWLERWLASYRGTVLLISHDRDFIDRVANQVLHFEQQQLTLYSGNYSDFELQRSERLAQQQAQYRKQQDEIAHIQHFVDRFKAQATKARQAQSRLKALERMQRIAPAHVDSPFHFSFPCAQKVSSPLLNVRDASVGYGQQLILRDLGFSLLPGSRVGLLGANGAGKSTLIKLMMGLLPLRSGTRVAGEHFACGHFAQHQLEALDLDASPLLHLQRLSPDASEQQLRNFLGGFAFQGDETIGSIRHFSGGEKARLALAIVAWQRPNLLLLDEPTNHLDLEMRQALTMALQDFEGAVVLVSHDRHLLRNSVDEFWLVAAGHVKPFDGDLDDYEQWLSRRTPASLADTASASEADTGKVKGIADKGARKRSEAEQRQRLAPVRKQLAEAEKRMGDLDRQARLLEAELAAPDLYAQGNKLKLQQLLHAQSELRKAIEETESNWLLLSETIESLSG